MKGNKAQPIKMKWVIATAVLALAAVIAAFLPAGSASAADVSSADPAISAVPMAESPDASCLGCHGKPGQTITLPDGEVLSISIDGDLYLHTVHGEYGLACSACHTSITGYPHPELTVETHKEFSFEATQSCQKCHEDQYEAVKDSIHQQGYLEGNNLAPACTDCHNPHTQTKLVDEDGNTLVEARVNIPVTCSKCHIEIFDEYKKSVHGSSLLVEGNNDTPTCIDCHSVHDVPAIDNAFRLRSPQICSDCHANKELMDKYGLSAEVNSTYISDFHGTTVTIFEKTAPDQQTNTPVCIDCHGVHNMTRSDDPNNGLHVKENLLRTCQKCHPDANENFPASWMSHYIASPTQAPLVYYVNLFYKILIPGVIGTMVIYVILDFIRRLIEKRKGVSHD
jgi:nitrate/TMAO reductase-like tetraheme cytochrome c subunit